MPDITDISKDLKNPRIKKITNDCHENQTYKQNDITISFKHYGV